MGARSTLPPALSGASLGLGGTSTVPDTLPADAPVDGDSVARFDVPEALRYDEGGTIGQGGMGIVRSARDQRLGREVALKLPRRGQVDGEARLVQEATLTAGLFHPGIVPVYGAGRHPDGRPYYTMPVLRGTSLAEALGRATDLESRLAYVRHFLDATEAVAYAHSRGVLHRDLKPANIMVGEFGETHVVDWGLAGQVGAPAAQRNSEGRKVVAGTPGYMSPEQRAGGVLGTESDVFSLGAVMWEILTGQLPPAEGRLPVLAVTPGAPPELSAIAERALAGAPGDRYPDARALAADLASWFEGRRVEAYTYSVWELLARLWTAWRVPIAVGIVGAVGLALAIGLGFRETAAERDRAVAAEQVAVVAKARSDHNLARALVSQAAEAASRGRRAHAEVLAAGALALEESPEARGVLARFGERPRPTGAVEGYLGACDRAALAPGGDEVACVRGNAVGLVGVDGEERALAEFDTAVASVAYARDGLRLVSTRDRRLWRWPDGEQPYRLPNDHKGEYFLNGGSPDGLVLGNSSGTIWLIDERQGSRAEVAVCPGPGGASDARFAADGSVLFGCRSGTLMVYDPATGVSRVVWRADRYLFRVAGDVDDPRRVAVGGVKGLVTVVDVDGVVEWERLLGPDPPRDLALRGDLLAVAGALGDVTVWDVRQDLLVARLPSGAPRLSWRGDRLRVVDERVVDWEIPAPGRPEVFTTDAGVAGLAVSPDGRSAASAHGDGGVRMWTLDRPAAHVLRWIDDDVLKDVAYSADGSRLAVGAAMRAGVSILDATDGSEVAREGHTRYRRVGWMDGYVLGGAFSSALQVWSEADGGLSPYAVDVPMGTVDLRVDADRSGAVVLDIERALWRLTTQPDGELRVRSLGLVPQASSVAWAGGEVVLGLTHQIVFRPLDGDRGAERRMEVPGSAILDVATSPDGRLLAAGHVDGEITVWQLEDMTMLARLRGHASRVASVEFSSDGAWLVSGSWDGTLRQWAVRPMLADPVELGRELEAAWGMGVDAALRR